MMTVTMTDGETTASISADIEQCSELLERLIVPAMIGMGYTPETVRDAVVALADELSAP